MLEQGVGNIINVASIAGLVGIADRAAYNASKHGRKGCACQCCLSSLGDD